MVTVFEDVFASRHVLVGQARDDIQEISFLDVSLNEEFNHFDVGHQLLQIRLRPILLGLVEDLFDYLLKASRSTTHL